MKKQRVRIIGGTWRSRLIHFPDIEGLRPTPDRVRETLFNWLGQDLSGQCCLDLYAGSGVLGFEAASRGAKSVVMVERDPLIYHALKASQTQLLASQVSICRQEAFDFLRSDRFVYDGVLLDPPFTQNPWPELFAALETKVSPQGWVYCESAMALQCPMNWKPYRQARAGQVNYQLLKRIHP